MERYAWSYRALPGLLRRGLVAPLAHALPYGFRRVKTALATAATSTTGASATCAGSVRSTG